MRYSLVKTLVFFYAEYNGIVSMTRNWRPCPNYGYADHPPSSPQKWPSRQKKMLNELKKVMGVKFHITLYRVWAPRTSKRGVFIAQKCNFFQKWPNFQAWLELTWRSFFHQKSCFHFQRKIFGSPSMQIHARKMFPIFVDSIWNGFKLIACNIYKHIHIYMYLYVVWVSNKQRGGIYSR